MVGLGHMGDRFAENLLADRYTLTAFDKDPARIQALAEKGTQAAKGWAT
jgi:3-hydroxyisobutyrate dehydrogenase-like beta-hydroxyacid dehydrogenase